MAALEPKRTWQLYAIIGAVLVVSLLIVMLGQPTWQSGLIRWGALVGYQGVFLAALSALYLVELTKYFGRGFIKLHHIVSIMALSTLVLHGGMVAWQFGQLRVLAPRFTSVENFVRFGGAPALWLIILAALAAWQRKNLRDQWRPIHWLTYIAFILGTIHAQMLGGSFQHLVVRIISIAMAVALVAVFATKRLRQQKRRNRSKA